jgi:hypothetical protein
MPPIEGGAGGEGRGGGEGGGGRERRLLYDCQSVSQYVLVSSTLVGLATRYHFLSECCCGVLGRPL